MTTLFYEMLKPLKFDWNLVESKPNSCDGSNIASSIMETVEQNKTETVLGC